MKEIKLTRDFRFDVLRELYKMGSKPVNLTPLIHASMVEDSKSRLYWEEVRGGQSMQGYTFFIYMTQEAST